MFVYNKASPQVIESLIIIDGVVKIWLMHWPQDHPMILSGTWHWLIAIIKAKADFRREAF